MKYKFEYTGGFWIWLAMTFCCLTVILIPMAVILLFQSLEIHEINS